MCMTATAHAEVARLVKRDDAIVALVIAAYRCPSARPLQLVRQQLQHPRSNPLVSVRGLGAYAANDMHALVYHHMCNTTHHHFFLTDHAVRGLSHTLLAHEP